MIDVGAPDDMGSTREEDTKRLADRLLEEEVDLIIFAGGDGTARIVSSVIGEQIPVVGIPAGVKIHSGVYAINPRNAGRAVKNFITGEITRTKEAEVMDLDEELYRKGVISPRLYGYMRVPDDKRSIQNVKMRSVSQTAALDYIGAAGRKKQNRINLSNTWFCPVTPFSYVLLRLIRFCFFLPAAPI